MIRQSFQIEMRRSFAVWLLYLLLVASLMLTTACGDLLGKSYPPYRYRLTVEVETPQGPRIGSSVIEVRTYRAARWMPSGGGGGGVGNSVKGEAAAVDLPNGETVFALLRTDWGPEFAEIVYPLQVPYPTAQEVAARSPDGKWDPDLNFDMWMERVEAARGMLVVPRWRKRLPGQLSGWPMLVRFRNIRDSASVEEVKPEALEATFGKGYTIRQITVERTEDAVSNDISERLPWLLRKDCFLAPHPRERDGSLVPLKDVSLAVKLNCRNFRRSADAG